MGKHAMPKNEVRTNTQRLARYHVAFVDEFTGDEAAEDFGYAYETAADARGHAEASWKETAAMGDETNASEIEWEGPIGTCTYEMSHGDHSNVHKFTCKFIVTRH